MQRTGLVQLLVVAGCAACASLPPSAAPAAEISRDATAAASRPVATHTLPPIDRLPGDFAHGGDEREASAIDLIVVHSIGGPTCRDGAVYFTPAGGSAAFWRDWFLEQGGKSIHYVIGREGDIAQQRPELRTAGHVSFGGIMAAVNQRSIGIELVNRGDGIEPFPEAQIAALKALVADIAQRYSLPPEALVTHAALDDRRQPNCGGVPLRRSLDPGPLFPLDEVRSAITPE